MLQGGHGRCVGLGKGLLRSLGHTHPRLWQRQQASFHVHLMANDALAPKRRRSDPAEPQLHHAADADAQERGGLQEHEAHAADAMHALAQDQILLLQEDNRRLQEDIRLLQAERSRDRAACADKDSEILSLQNLVVGLQPLVAPSRMLAAAFPPPPGGNDSDDDGIAGEGPGREGPGMRVLHLALLPPPSDQTRTDAVALFDEAMVLLTAGRYRCAVSKLKRAVALGHVAAYAELAWLLTVKREGMEVCSNCYVPGCVVRLSKLGSDRGCPHSRGVYALKSLFNYTSGNFRGRQAVVRGLQLAHQSAAAGSKYGQYVLGRSYLSGFRQRLPQDVAQALVYFRLAAEQGLEMAQLELGELYAGGHGVAQDHAAAAVWYRRAAQQGYGPACMALSKCYADGDGVDTDRFQAIYWYKRAYVAGIQMSSEPHLRDLGVSPEELTAISVRWDLRFRYGCGMVAT